MNPRHPGLPTWASRASCSQLQNRARTCRQGSTGPGCEGARTLSLPHTLLGIKCQVQEGVEPPGRLPSQARLGTPWEGEKQQEIPSLAPPRRRGGLGGRPLWPSAAAQPVGPRREAQRSRPGRCLVSVECCAPAAGWPGGTPGGLTRGLLSSVDRPSHPHSEIVCPQ